MISVRKIILDVDPDLYKRYLLFLHEEGSVILYGKL